jgi:hypothetical protein
MREAGVSAGKITSGTRRKQNERGFHSLRQSWETRPRLMFAWWA